jgi:hypothetical protein
MHAPGRKRETSGIGDGHESFEKFGWELHGRLSIRNFDKLHQFNSFSLLNKLDYDRLHVNRDRDRASVPATEAPPAEESRAGPAFRASTLKPIFQKEKRSWKASWI